MRIKYKAISDENVKFFNSSWEAREYLLKINGGYGGVICESDSHEEYRWYVDSGKYYINRNDNTPKRNLFLAVLFCSAQMFYKFFFIVKKMLVFIKLLFAKIK